MITKGKITDQILRLYTGGNPSDDKEISRDDINLIVGQVINRLLKLEHLSINMQSGEMFPPHTLITTYKVPVQNQSSEGFTYAQLPVMPISLPRNMGVWRVYVGSYEYIPLESGQHTMIGSQDQLKYLETQTGYYVEGNLVKFTDDITASPFNVSHVRVQLLVVDPTILGEYDYLAIPAEMEEQVIKEVLTLIGALPKVVDKTSDSNNQI